jgi:hypothetical protein
MKDYQPLKEFFSELEEDYILEKDMYFGGSVNWISLVEENEYHIPEPYYQCDYTKKNIFYVILGYLILKYSNKYILDNFLYKITKSIKEIEINYKKLELTEEEQLEILNLAKQVKDGLPKLKVFTDSHTLIELEKKEYLESQQK